MTADQHLRALLANMSPEDAAVNAHWLGDDTAVATSATKQPSPLELKMASILGRLSHDLDIPPIETEYRFNTRRKHRADFAIPEWKMLIECEGGGWLKTSAGNNKGHSHPKRFENDCEKYNIATSLGWNVYRFTGAMIRDGRAESFLRSVIPPF